MKTTGPFVLLVEDDDQLRKILALALKAKGYMVLQAATFREAVTMIAIRPDLAILDIRLPDGSGWEITKWLESLGASVPTIYISATTPERRVDREKLQAFLPKPFPVGDLLELAHNYAPLAA